MADFGEDILDAFHKQMEEAWRCPQCGVGFDVENDQSLRCHCDTRQANLPDHGTIQNPCPNAKCGYCDWEGTKDVVLEGSYTEHYQGFKWIKVKRFDPDPDGCQDLKAHFREFERHHEKETEFLIAEIRKLAAKLDAQSSDSDQG